MVGQLKREKVYLIAAILRGCVTTICTSAPDPCSSASSNINCGTCGF
jgi:hypothetical protein